MTQQPGDDPLAPGRPGEVPPDSPTQPVPARVTSEPPVYGTPAPGGPAPAPPPPPPGYQAPGYGGAPAASPGYGQPPAPGQPPAFGQPPAHGQPPAAAGWGQQHPSGPPAPGSVGTDVQEERQWALFAHLGGVLAIFPVFHLLPALVIFSIYRTRSEFVRDQAREALNFQLVVLIAFFAARILNALPLFPNLVVLVWLFSLVFSVLAAVAAGRGDRYRYPLTYRFLT